MNALRELYEIDEATGEIRLSPMAYQLVSVNKLIRSDYGSPNDSTGKKRLLTQRKLAWIYMFLNPKIFQLYEGNDRIKQINKSLGFPDDFQADEIMLLVIDDFREILDTDIYKLLRAAKDMIKTNITIFETSQKRNSALISQVSNIDIVDENGNINQPNLIILNAALDTLEANFNRTKKILIDIPNQLENIDSLENKYVKEIAEYRKKRGAINTVIWEDK